MFTLLEESKKNWEDMNGINRHGGILGKGGWAPCSMADLVVNFRNDMVCLSSLNFFANFSSLAVIKKNMLILAQLEVSLQVSGMCIIQWVSRVGGQPG